MSILNNKTEKEALKIMAAALKHFEKLEPYFLNAEDSFKARLAENALRTLIEANGYYVVHRIGKGMKLVRSKTR